MHYMKSSRVKNMQSIILSTGSKPCVNFISESSDYSQKWHLCAFTVRDQKQSWCLHRVIPCAETNTHNQNDAYQETWVNIYITLAKSTGKQWQIYRKEPMNRKQMMLIMEIAGWSWSCVNESGEEALWILMSYSSRVTASAFSLGYCLCWVLYVLTICYPFFPEFSVFLPPPQNMPICTAHNCKWLGYKM